MIILTYLLSCTVSETDRKSLYSATLLAFNPQTEGFPWDDLRKIFLLSVQSLIKLATCEWALLKSQGHFYCAALNAERSSQEKAVCLFVSPSVRPSVQRVHCDRTEERSVRIFMPYERSFSLVF